jgi:chromosome segregation protein
MQLTIDVELTMLDERRAEAESLLEIAAGSRTKLHTQLREINGEIQSHRLVWQHQRDQLHAHEIEANDLRHRCQTLVSRLAEDYQIDLVAEYEQTDLNTLATVEDPAKEQQEVEDLRKKLHRLGGVNLDALAELAQIEKKSGHLLTQFEDLTHARRSLEEIIQRINVDSKRMFLDTLTAIKEHFQDLFRLLFGGGVADIVLANPDEPLDSDIDILARPPGKELRSISLMSGGERTLTAVALLLAIFRSKPSPFCLLDEVDAALDEANTARLTTVLRDFANTAQFIVVTHAKRTMAAADMLYGITMQESGISKRVAVRFEDWPEDQRIAA